MQDYNTIIGILGMRLSDHTYDMIQRRHHVGSSTVTLILDRYEKSGLTFEQIQSMTPKEVERLFYPPSNFQKKELPLPDYQHYYDRIHEKGSKLNIAYFWIEYKQKYPDGYGKSQFYENYNRFVEEHYGAQKATMAVERIPGERMYIDWVGDQPELLVDMDTGELLKVHVFATTLGYSSMIYADIFLDEKLPHFIAGVVGAVRSYGGAAKYFVPDNLKTAVKKHTRDELILQSMFSDLEDFYGTIVLPPPPRKPRGKATVEAHVRFLETHLIEKLKEQQYTSLEELRARTKEIVAALNKRTVTGSKYTREEAFERFDKPCLNPLPDGDYIVCDYKYFNRVPDNYHLEYDGHYYSVLYTYRGQPAILKATAMEIRICDQYNRLICKHTRAFREFPKYITDDSHMKPDHLFYKEVNAKDGAYYRRWASCFGPSMSEFIDRILKSYKHEEQGYNSCNGILHKVKDLPHGVAEETARTCIAMNSCKYSDFMRVLPTVKRSQEQSEETGTLPKHNNIRGKEYYR